MTLKLRARDTNQSIIDQIEQELPESTAYYLLMAMVVAMAWTIYLTYYHSRVMGIIIGLVLNRFVKYYGHIKFGSFSFSVLSGKIMFRDFHIITEDYSLRVQYGWIIFRWWRPYIFRAINEDMSHSETRMSLYVDGVEFHVYNRSSYYAQLEKLFGLKPTMVPEKNMEEPVQNRIQVPEEGMHWRDLVPVIKVDINSGRCIFGNYMVPYTLIASFEEAHLIYTTKPASTPFDQFMHVVKCKSENMRVMMVPSLNYKGSIVDEPPRNMGEGFVIMQSNDIDIYYYMDEPGLVPHEPELVEMADGEVVVRRTYPCLGVDIKCGKKTDFNYGPWVDRQREHLWKFFYPVDYQPLVVTTEPEPSQRRVYKTFETKINCTEAATFDILFTKNSVTQAIHINTNQGSYVEFIIPWMIEEDGYKTKVKGQLMLLDASTSMLFRNLAELETLEFDVTINYPMTWNEYQEWRCDFTACKATVSLIYEHMNFFKDLVEDWSSKSKPDLYSFVPYTWSLNLIIKEFELVATVNEYNWIDTTSQTPENAQIAFCGEYFDLSLQLPFTDFLPNIVTIPIVIKGETVFCRLYLPESNTSRHVIIALSENMKIADRDGNELDRPFGYTKGKQWRNLTQKSAGWIDCWWTSHVALSINYNYHPMPYTESNTKIWQDLEDLTTPEKEETLLQPLRPGKSDSVDSNKVVPENFDASKWEPDMVNVELEVAPSVLCLYGSLLVNLLNIKENYVGEDQKVYDFSDSPNDNTEVDTGHVHDTGLEDETLEKFDPRAYRPFAVTVSVTLHDIQAQLLKNCNPDDVPCPTLHVERLCFEMDKSYLETKLQLLLSPSVLIARDNVVRSMDQDHLKEGHLALSGLQVRGHAMFSHEGLSLNTETLEYAWLVEVIIGEVTGKLTSPEIQNIAEFLQTFIMLVEDPENHLQKPIPYKLCQHMLPQPQCRMLPKCPFPCPSADDIKYRMVRLSVDSINLFMVESGAAFNLKVNPIRISTCNLHGTETRAGITGIVEHISFTQRIACTPLDHGSPEVWLEAGSFSLGPINVEAAMAIPTPEIQIVQDEFLKAHDKKTKRLWFLWPLEAMGPGNHPHTLGKCGCQGGCRFFGNNKNGISFFRSRRHRDTPHAAIPQVCADGHDPGFGQSLLQKDKLVFDICQNHHRESPSCKKSPTEFSFTRGYMSDIASPDTPGDPLAKVLDSTGMGSISEQESAYKRHSGGEVSFSGDSKTQLFDPNEKSDKQFLTTTMTDGSLDSGTNEKQSPDLKLHGKASFSSSSPSSPVVGAKLTSKRSFNSGASRTPSKTSLPSPISVHSHDGISRMTSTVSLESQQYFSAEEDLEESDKESVINLPVFEGYGLDTSDSHLKSSPLSDKGYMDDSLATTVLEKTVQRQKSDSTISETSSSSTLSYESVGSVNSAEAHEEFSLVDLHNQMNQPMTSSPLLLSCYSNHLSHYHCNDWATAPPSANLSTSGSRGMRSVYSEYSLSSASHSAYGSGSSWLPHFTKVKDGFSTSVMREKEELKLPSPPAPDKSKSQFFFPGRFPSMEENEEEDLNDELCQNTSKTTAVIKVAGSLDVLLTPLLLESMQRYIETVTPTLAKLHSSALLDRIHSQCIDRLKQQNKLKEETANKEEENKTINLTETDGKKDTKDISKTTSFRAFFSLPKINICVLQASIVEEVISFSMLENISDVTAVSLLAVCVDNIKCQLLSNNHSCKVPVDANTFTEAVARQAAVPPGQGHGSSKNKPEVQINDHDKEPISFSEVNREENVGTLQIARIHTQLRRLVKESNFSDNIILTAIPDYRSNVLFSFNPEVIVASPMGMPSSPRRRLSRQASRESNDPDFIIGFIMFECGLEDVSLTAVRRLGYKENSDVQFQQRMDTIEQTLQNLQESTKEQLEQQTDPSTSPTDDPLPHSSPSARHSSVSMSSTFGSRTSLKSDNSDQDHVIPIEIEPLKGDASNGRLDLKTIWLNFAAPPPISIKKKVDFTRMDWNLLSTATPSINAWMNPSDRAMVAVRSLVRVLTHRTSSVLACIMTEALEVQGIHVCYKSKFGKATNLSKTLQEEPSCQLLTVLRKYLRKYGTASVEQAVRSETIPNLITMQKGILALTRQWKNVLYMPYLSELSFKNKKNVRPYNVTFALPGDAESSEMYMDEGEGILDQYDVVDEKTSLLQAEGGSVQKSVSNPSIASRSAPSAKITDTFHDGCSPVSNMSNRNRKTGTILVKKGSKAGLPHILSCVDSPEKKPQVSAPLPTPLPTPLPNPLPIPLPTILMTRNESTHSFVSVPESICSSEQGMAPTPPPTPMRHIGPKQSILKNRYDKSEDLYQWMAKQQEDLKIPMDEESNYVKGHDSWLLGSSWSQDESRTDINEDNVTMATSIMQLADAQMLFKPLLQSLGLHVEGVRPSAMMKKFGGYLLLQGSLDVLKIQIADSEDSKSRAKSKGKGKGKRYRLNINAATPAFQCEGFGINICMKDVVDFGAKESVFPDRNKQNPWKFAMHKLEAKPTTLQVNFVINCQRITQHVDMSLLRLVHQFVTMVDNIKETQVELKERRPSLLGEWMKTHRKQESKDSTSSADTQQSELSKQEQQAEVTLSTPTHSVRSETPSDAGDKTLTRTTKNTPSFKLPIENLRPERLSFSSIRKPHLRFARDKNKKESTPGQTEILTPPQSLNLSDTVTIDMVDTSSPALAEKTIVDEIKESTPRCWRHLYHLLELYSTMPETKTVLRKSGIQKLPIIEEEPEKDGTLKQRETPPSEETPTTDEVKSRVDMAAEEENCLGNHPPLAQTSFIRTRFKQSIYIGESIPLVVYGIAKVERVQMLAVLSGLKLEAELRKVHASGTYKEKVKGFLHRKSAESSFTAHVGHTMIVLLEGVPPNMQTVVTVNISRSQALHTTVMKRGKEHNSALASIGVIDVDIPQHPVVLHGMMTRSSRQLTSTLQEFRRPLARMGKVQDIMEQISGEQLQAEKKQDKEKYNRAKKTEKEKPVTLHIHFKAVLQGFTIGASILPSLKAQHKTGCITVAGMTGKKARFTVVLPKHTLSFKSKVTTTETSIPSSASIEMPPIHVYADYRTYKAGGPVSDTLTEGLVLKEGSYLNAVAEVGMLEHSLTTDLLNHLVFVQKVFMKEVNEVVQKVSGSDQPVHVWADDQTPSAQSHPRKPLLYSFSFRFKGIQVTATTPTSNAVRLETGEIELEMSNRVQMASRELNPDIEYEHDNQKVFIRAQIDLNVSLGQLLKNPVFEEAEPEFQTMAFFKTKIGVRNAIQDEMIPGVATEQEALLITVSRPIVLAQPLAFDKAVLVWLNYKNAYEYWTEQRMALNTEVQTATRQVFDRLPQLAPAAGPALSTLFLQLTVDDMGICVPLESPTLYQKTAKLETEPGAALVLTVESTQISACSSGSLVSKGRFKGFCLRFADDFETSWDDWKPNTREEPNMNIMVVPAGTYEVCSRTDNKQASDPKSNAKWILNVQWEMQGLDVHFDTDIGKRLSALGHTLTALAGETNEDEEFIIEDEDHVDETDNDATDTEMSESVRRTSLVSDILPDIIFTSDMAPKERVRQIEREMNEQAKIVQDLRELGASQSTIEAERRKLEELQALVFRDFRRDVFNKIKKQSERASVIKDKLGIGSRPAHIRSRSYGGHHGRRTESSENTKNLSKTLDNRHTRIRPISADLPLYNPSSRVQFGTVPTGATDRSVSLDIDMFDEKKEEQMAPSFYVQDMTTSESELSYESDSDVSVSGHRKKFQHSRRPRSTTIESSQSIPGVTRAEPSIDFELDIKVFIDSGKCVLYPKEAKEEEVKKQLKREKSGGLGGDMGGSPVLRRKMKRQDSSPSLLSSGKKTQQQQSTTTGETTVFFLPSVDVKVHYNSKTTASDSLSGAGGGSSVDITRGFSTEAPTPVFETPLKSTDQFDFPSQQTTSQDIPVIVEPTAADSCSNQPPSKRGAIKRANLYAWLSLNTLPEEMIISPCLLDFLEQALEPLPISQPTVHKKVDVMGSVLNMELDASHGSLTSPVGLASFPVDVVVFIRVERSMIRFNCIPISRVECVLNVPSLELVFSTKKADVETPFNEGTPPSRAKVPKRGEKPMGSNAPGGSRARLGSTLSDNSLGTQSGGLSVTGTLSNFSLYIFHPYGGGQRRMGQTASPSYSQRGLGNIPEGSGSSLLELQRKDSLSLNVEFIKVNISRSRKMDFRSGDNITATKLDPQQKCNMVRFSAVCDIGAASFKYDMRRLSEILSLPKAWYRRNLARRLFLGDDSFGQNLADEYDPLYGINSWAPGENYTRPSLFTQTSVSYPSLVTSDVDLSYSSKPSHRRTASSGDKYLIIPDFEREIAENKHETKGAKKRQPQRSPTDFSSETYQSPTSRRSSSQRNKTKQYFSPDLSRTRHTSTQTSVTSSWETLVLFAVNLSRLELDVNMSNVMGNTMWTTKDVKSQGRLSIDSSGHKNLRITAGLGSSSFESRGGVIGGAIDIQGIHGLFQVKEDPDLGHDPDHRAGLSLDVLEGRVDYMGSSVLMTRLNMLDLLLRDDWHVERDADLDTPVATKRPAYLFVNGELLWDQFHIMISRSTTPDLIKLVSKLEEFFAQQLTSSKRVLSAFGQLSSKPSSHHRHSKLSEDVLSELRHHRHWQGALEHLVGCRFSMLSQILPEEGMVLGGSVTLKGENLCLASFHGINFRSKSWALFNIKKPYISFSTEAQKMEDDSTHIIQDLNFIVGGAKVPDTTDQQMVTICKLSRGHYVPQQFTSVQEWFSYAFATNEIKDLDSFPTIVKDRRAESPPEHRKMRKSQVYNHETEIIFGMPSMTMNLKTSHLQSKDEPRLEDPQSVVECTFVTEFHDHINVAMDAEVILFLHDLVSSYIKEKDKGARSSFGRSPRSPDLESKKTPDPTAALKQDWREFKCKTWQLEPTVRLLHWASRQIDPVGVDYVLQKLGFTHARVTIPKWVQRGFMDPVDKVVSVLVDKLIVSLQDKPDSEEGMD